MNKHPVLLYKTLVIVIIFLFVGMSINPSTGTRLEKNISKQPYDRGILYVGGSGPGNYTTIQDAIDNSSDGDTVFVYNGIYYESLEVDKSINLIGEDKYTTIIDGSNNSYPDTRIIDVVADWVKISGFTVQNGRLNWHAIMVDYFNNTIITGNIVKNHGGVGILLRRSNNSSIIDNTVSDSYYGIGCVSYSFNNNVTGNTILSNIYGIYFGSSYNNCSNNYISQNTIGIEIDNGAGEVKYVKIMDNTITKNGNVGIRLSNYNHNCTFSNNIINSNKNSGIKLAYASEYHIFKENNISLNGDYGIKIHTSYDNNLFYHNNFINNTPKNAYDESNNIWDNGYPSGGNYWDDYTGTDSDGDGIGDTPYPIPGGDNEDRYPLMKPCPPIANFTYSTEEPHVLFNASSSYDLDGEIVSYDWDFGDGIIGCGEITYHKYCEVGTYDVTLTVTDNDGLKGNITKSVDVLFENIPPSIPDINGPNTGKPGVEYEYVFNIIDPDGDDCRIWVGWGDGNSTGWKGPYPSGETVKLKHSWNETGTYMIKAKIMDYCDESLWGTLEVTIPRYRASSYIWFGWLLDCLPLLERLLSFLLL